MKRIDDYTFECMLGTLSFLGFKITPTVTAKVDVRPNGVGPMISVEEATISGEDCGRCKRTVPVEFGERRVVV